MATGTSHYRQAEQALRAVENETTDAARQLLLAEAQAHATLALAWESLYDRDLLRRQKSTTTD